MAVIIFVVLACASRVWALLAYSTAPESPSTIIALSALGNGGHPDAVRSGARRPVVATTSPPFASSYWCFGGPDGPKSPRLAQTTAGRRPSPWPGSNRRERP